MPFVPVPHLFSITQTLAQPNGDQCLNVFHGRMVTGSINETAADSICAAIRNSWFNHLRTWVASAVTMQTYTIRDLSVAGGRTYYYTPTATTGADGTNILPEQLAVCTTLNRGSGPSQRGRVYNGGFTVAALAVVSTRPVVKAATIADVDLWVEDVGSAFSDNGARWVVYSRKLAALTDVDVARTPTDQRWDVQRRRANHRPVI